MVKCKLIIELIYHHALNKIYKRFEWHFLKVLPFLFMNITRSENKVK